MKHSTSSRHGGQGHDGPNHDGPNHDGPNHDGPNHDGQTAFLLTQVGTEVNTRFAQLVAQTGLTPPHAGLLRAIAIEPGRSQQEVAVQLGLLPSKLVTLVDDLEGKGLVQRRRNVTDRRLYALELTAAGHDVMREIGRVAQAHGATALKPLTRAERATLHSLLSRLADHHGLRPGVHPGYRDLGRGDTGSEGDKPQSAGAD